MEKYVKKTIRKTKKQMRRWHKKRHQETENKELDQLHPGNCMLRRPKHSTNKVVAPNEEEEVIN